MKKHAYLIIAHNHFEQLKTLLHALDDERNDIFIHIDKKARKFKINDFDGLLKHSACFFTERTNVIWGSYSQIKSELILLEAAAEGHYEYYHLLSGADFPIKSQDEIHAFFEKNKGKEFIDFEGPVFRKEKEVLLKYYYFFQEKFFGRSRLLDFLDQMSIKVQKAMGIDRLKDQQLVLQKGANWFSITDDFVQYLLSKESFIRKTFQHTKCCDEVFLQTIAVNSAFKNNLADPLMQGIEEGFVRHIDWNRGQPYTFRMSDLEELLASDSMFARKFDETVDDEIIKELSARL